MARKPKTNGPSREDLSDVIAEDIRRVAQPETRPEFLDDAELGPPLTPDNLEPDGGNPQHPTHDEPFEDMQPEDYEELTEDARRAKLDRVTDDEYDDPAHGAVFSEGSNEPNDIRDRGPSPFEKPRDEAGKAAGKKKG